MEDGMSETNKYVATYRKVFHLDDVNLLEVGSFWMKEPEHSSLVEGFIIVGYLDKHSVLVHVANGDRTLYVGELMPWIHPISLPWLLGPTCPYRRAL